MYCSICLLHACSI
uniref:Uncharacterized protein n=1 Tax=Anopheles dirus TaxID=7168 RepID=A0A182NWY5_9DIPT